MTSRRILKEYVKSVLLEDEGYGGSDYAAMGDSPYGISWGGPSLFKIFVQPFSDVLQTGQAAVEDLSARARTAAKVAFEAVATSILPFYSSDYKEIFEKEAEQIGKIKEKYRDVFERTDAAFAYSGDAMLLAFLLDPTALISATVLKKAPAAALEVFETLAGENEHLRALFKKLKIVSRGSSGKSKESEAGVWTTKGGGKGGGWGGGDYMGGGGAGIGLEGKLHEKKKANPNEILVTQLSNPKVQAELQKSPVVMSMKKDARALVNSTVNQLMDRYKQVSSAKSVEDLIRIFPQVNRSKLQALQGLPPDQKAPVEAAIMTQLKASAKEFYAKSLQAQIEQSMKQGIPESHPLLQGYKKVISMIKSS